jgi:hypothetical protein
MRNDVKMPADPLPPEPERFFGRKGYFFLPLSTSPFLNRQIFWNRLSSPPILDQLRKTELAPLLNKDEKTVFFLILMDNGSAAFSLLNKVFNSI